MSERAPRPEAPELKIEQEKREVARTFVFQSTDSKKLEEKIKATMAQTGESYAAAIAHTALTHCLWLEKDTSSRNPGQIIPIGGGQDPVDRGSFLLTALRELLQETHLRPIQIKQLLSEHTKNAISINYQMTEKKEGHQREVDNTQYLFWARILPSDIPYQLDKAEDKIAEFHELTLDEMGSLWGENELDHAGKKLKLLDSLRLFPKNVASEKIDITFDQDITAHATAVAEVMRSLGTEARAVEIAKLQDVAHELYEIFKWKNPAIDSTKNPIDTALTALRHTNDLSQARELYATAITLCESMGLNLEEWFAHAVERSNVKEELRNPGNSNIEAALRLGHLLTETNLSLQELADLKQEIDMEQGPPRPLNPYHNMIDFLGKLTHLANPEAEFSEDSIVAAIQNTSSKEVNAKFTTTTGIADIGAKLADLDTFISNMITLGVKNKETGEQFNPGTVNPITNTINANLKELLRFAFDPKASPFTDKTLSKRLRFEALRKIFLLHTLEPAIQRFKEAMEIGNTHIEALWTNILTFESGRNHVISITDKDGNAHEHTMRSFASIPGLLAEQNARPKKRTSYLRKIIVRGFDNPYDVWDIFGRSLELAPDPKADPNRQRELFTRVNDTIKTHTLDKDGALLPEFTVNVLEYPAVIEIIRLLQAHGAIILDYDPTNQPGTNFNSSGPGGGDPIVMAKFYVLLTDEDNTRHMEEVQIFSPTEDGVSSFEHKEIKSQFDAQYAVKRLTDTKGLRSFIELLLPASIYGTPVRTIYRKRNGNGQAKTRS